MRRPLMRLLAVSVAVMIPLLVVELLLRSFSPLHLAGYQGGYVYDEDLGYRLRPGSHYLLTTDHLQEIRTNELGTVNFQESFEPYEKLVYAIGDSYTQGTGLSADASYPFQLDMLLNTADGAYETRYGVVNLGLAAFGLEQSMIALERFSKQIGKPDYVLYFACGNDAADDALFASGYRHGHLVDGSPRWGIWVRPLQFLGYDTEIGKRLKLAFGRLRRGGILGGRAREGEGAGSGERNLAAPLEPGLGRLLEMVRERDAELVVSWTGWVNERGGSYRWLRAWAARNGVRFADWHPRAESVVRAIPTLGTMNPHSAGHHRPWMNLIIAQTFAEQILAAEGASGRAGGDAAAPE